jgi:hypothetical protein
MKSLLTGLPVQYSGQWEFRTSSRGNRYGVWKDTTPMPRIDESLLDCVAYLYHTEDDAREAQRSGGTAFLLGVPSLAIKDIWHLYVVSNRHVAVKNPIVRLCMATGESDILQVGDGWHYTSDQDVAVAPVILSRQHRFKFVKLEHCLTKEIAAARHIDIGLGDDVFMVGRLIGHDGKQRNLPSLRSGIISMTPMEPVYHESNSGKLQESYLVEIRSICGYSGSPVFVRLPCRDLIRDAWPNDFATWQGRSPGPWLLGVEWGYIGTHKQEDNNTGISGVVPAWILKDLLMSPKLAAQREQVDRDKANEMAVGRTVET